MRKTWYVDRHWSQQIGSQASRKYLRQIQCNQGKTNKHKIEGLITGTATSSSVFTHLTCDITFSWPPLHWFLMPVMVVGITHTVSESDSTLPSLFLYTRSRYAHLASKYCSVTHMVIVIAFLRTGIGLVSNPGSVD